MEFTHGGFMKISDQLFSNIYVRWMSTQKNPMDLYKILHANAIKFSTEFDPSISELYINLCVAYVKKIILNTDLDILRQIKKLNNTTSPVSQQIIKKTQDGLFEWGKISDAAQNILTSITSPKETRKHSSHKKLSIKKLSDQENSLTEILIDELIHHSRNEIKDFKMNSWLGNEEAKIALDTLTTSSGVNRTLIMTL